MWLCFLLTAVVVATTERAFAHVKWFVETSFVAVPLSLGEVLTPTFFALTLLSMVTIGALVLLDTRMLHADAYGAIDEWLANRQEQSVVVMRVAAGAVLLMNWQADAMLVPEFSIGSAWVGWLQFALALLLLFQKTTPIAGLGMILLYLYAVQRFGIFHMLDYMHYPGVGFFLAVSRASERSREAGIPALYASVGFSLCWVALEKIIFPQWGLFLLDEHPQLALGFPLEFFLLAAAFVEFSLGYLLILGVLGRPLALTITIVFFLTTLVFGKTEVIGHTLLHGALIVFLLRGTGEVYRPPIAFHSRLPLRVAFGAFNFALLLAMLIVPYTVVARELHESYDGPMPHGHVKLDVSPEASIPAIDVALVPDSESGWNAELRVDNFRFTPERAGASHVMGEGHVHLEIDGVKLARWYAPWGHIPALPRGEHKLRISLNTKRSPRVCFG